MGQSANVTGNNVKPFIYQPKKKDYRIWLVGDSILDNSYWNGVDANTTSEVLKTIMPQVEVLDRTTEELDAMTLLECL